MTIVAITVALIALLLSGWLLTQVMALKRRLAAVPQDGDVVGLLQELDEDLASAEKAVTEIRPRVAELESAMAEAVSFVSVVNYNAFGDITGNQSRSVALLDRSGSGLVISILVGRHQTLFYTKQVRNGRGVEELSPEEQSAVERALAG